MPLAARAGAGGRPAGRRSKLRFEGADRGVPRGRTETISFERSLAIDRRSAPDVLLVHRMNDAPLTSEHGAPLRLLVPGWYGMAAVKWLQRIEVLDRPLEAHYQTRQYLYYQTRPSAPTARAGASGHADQVAHLDQRADRIGRSMAGPARDPGVAWCGDAPDGQGRGQRRRRAWQPAELLGEPMPYTWRRWRFDLGRARSAGRHSIRARATAADGVRPARPAGLEPPRLRQQRGAGDAGDGSSGALTPPAGRAGAPPATSGSRVAWRRRSPC